MTGGSQVIITKTGGIGAGSGGIRDLPVGDETAIKQTV